MRRFRELLGGVLLMAVTGCEPVLVAGQDTSCQEAGSCADGSPCSDKLACASGFCVDGLCCNTPCADGCSSCVMLGREGLCTPYQVDAAAAPECAGWSCSDLLQRYPLAPDGVYFLDADGPGSAPPFSAYCDMTTAGGGWTLAMKIDGTNDAFTYLAPEWTNMDLVNPQSLSISVEGNAKLHGFNSVPFSSLLIGMRPSGSREELRYRTLPVAAASLYELFNGDYQPTYLGRESWLSLLPGAYIQPNCNAEGINFYNQGSVRIRLGVAGNNENNCINPDSYIGLGGGTHGACYAYEEQPAAGSVSCYPADKAPAFGVLFVR